MKKLVVIVIFALCAPFVFAQNLVSIYKLDCILNGFTISPSGSVNYIAGYGSIFHIISATDTEYTIKFNKIVEPSAEEIAYAKITIDANNQSILDDMIICNS